VYVPTGVWHEMESFSSGAVCLVLASQHYTPDEHRSDYDEFVASRPNTT
jgi:dTDP-4-dehydrorhamnose 3,5-epimerase-like enzyme